VKKQPAQAKTAPQALSLPPIEEPGDDPEYMVCFPIGYS
jgi:hypothetical protein